ncbi:MAG: SpoIID/LytB domain-containing protein [Candidatus Omnitrophota bacterium]
MNIYHNISIKQVIWISIAALLCVLVFRFLFVPVKSRVEQDPFFSVRVRLLHNISGADLSAKKGMILYDGLSGNVVDKKLKAAAGTRLSLFGAGIKLGEKSFNLSRLRITPVRGGFISINGTLYRGEICIVLTDSGLDIINRVGLEDYLKGVIPREVNCFWPVEMIKAQSIASRSFAVFEVLRRKNKEYDLTADTFSQVYGGYSGERWRTTRAVDATKGKVLEYAGKVLPGYFHSCCGGYTEDISNIWGKKSLPLRGVRCKWCRWSPHFRWQAKIAPSTIAERLNEKGYQIKNVDDIREGNRDRSRRLKYVRIKSHNRWLEISTRDFRSVMGRRVLKSANFCVKKYPSFYFFSGYGWGHGVGMCQWGAFNLSLRRKKEEQILQYYYPDANIRDLKDLISR